MLSHIKRQRQYLQRDWKLPLHKPCGNHNPSGPCSDKNLRGAVRRGVTYGTIKRFRNQMIQRNRS